MNHPMHFVKHGACRIPQTLVKDLMVGHNRKGLFQFRHTFDGAQRGAYLLKDCIAQSFAGVQEPIRRGRVNFAGDGDL